MGLTCYVLFVDCWLFVVYCLMPLGCWLSVDGYWLLVVGCWLLVKNTFVNTSCIVNSGVFFGVITHKAITLNICRALAAKRLVTMIVGSHKLQFE